MVFHKVTALSDLNAGYFGVREPEPTLAIIEKKDMGKDTLCLVPALSYDKRGYRLGYGKGYYDRFLEGFSGICVGITFDRCLAEKLPADAHDKKTDYIITESQVTTTIED